MEASIVDLEIQETSKFNFVIKTSKKNNELVYKGHFDKQKEGISINNIVIIQGDAITHYLCQKDSLLTTQKFNFTYKYSAGKTEKYTRTCKEARQAMLFLEGFSSYKKRVVDKLYKPIKSYEVPVAKAEVITSMSDQFAFFCRSDIYSQNPSICEQILETMK
ncbi:MULTISPECIES: hypothetical protein [Calothrix]|nr:hypothetical protein [Calothrix parietina]